MKRIAWAVGAILAAAAPLTMAQDYRDRDRDGWRDDQRWGENRWRDRDERRWGDSARVIDKQPIYARDSRQECWNPRAGHYEEVREENRTRIGKGAAIGAVAGGVLGHQVDSGGGTAAGAVIGGLLGHHLQKRNDANEQEDLDYSRCRVIGAAGNDIEGYTVRYEHDGREYVTQLAHDPGNRLELGRDIQRDGTPFDR